jgi:uncharacterized membrane protein (UPF0127 family)
VSCDVDSRYPQFLRFFGVLNPIFRRASRTQQAVVLVSMILCVLADGIGSVSAAELQLSGEVYQIEMAVTPAQRQQGLMHRSQLGHRQGMLLVYPQAGDRRIWMKNVLISLRVYWIDASFEVIEVQRLEPCRDAPCPIYAAGRDSQYVLELGDYDHPLAAGDKIEGIRGD